MSKILKQVTLDGVSRKRDKSVSVRFVTQTEQTPEELMEIDRLLDSAGVLYFKSNGILNEEEIKTLDGVNLDPVKEVKKKSESKKLRDAIYILWSKTDNGKVRDSEKFYNDSMDYLRGIILDKIPQD